jgi:hypothetical protein
VGVSVGVGEALAVDVGVGVGVSEGVDVGVRDGVGDSVGVGVGVRVAVAVAVGLGVDVAAGRVEVAGGGDVPVGCWVGRLSGAGSVVAAATAWTEAVGGTLVAPGPASKRGRAIKPRMAKTAARAGMAARSAHRGLGRRGPPQAEQVLLISTFTVPQWWQRTLPDGRQALPQPGQMRCPSCRAMPQAGQVLPRSFTSTLVPSSGSRLCLCRARWRSLPDVPRRTGSCTGARCVGLMETRKAGCYVTTRRGFRQVAR